MKVVIISGCAPPEPNCAGRIHWDISGYLADMGHEVWLLTPYASRPAGMSYEKSKNTKINFIKKNFYHVNLNSFTCPEYSFFLRAFESLHFGIKTTRFVNRKIKDYNLMYLSSWPLLSPLVTVLFRKNKSAPLIINIQDLYPESLFLKIKSAVIRNLLSPLYNVDSFIARSSSRITVISESLKEVYVNYRKIPANKITVLHNWQDESEYLEPLPSKDLILEKYGLKGITGKFTFMYLGNIGPVAGVETVVEAFARLSNDNAGLVVAGYGSCRDKCRKIAKDLKAVNIYFVEVPCGLRPVAELQNISDVLVLPIVHKGADSSIPSKLIAYMLSGKPVITSANSWSESAKAIHQSGSGWILESHGISDWMSAFSKALSADREKLISMGQSGREYALKNYSKKEGLKKMYDLYVSTVTSNAQKGF